MMMAGSSTLVRTAPFQGVEAGSNPAPATTIQEIARGSCKCTRAILAGSSVG